MPDVFVSYKRSERDRVRQLADLLRSEELDVWFDARLEVGRGEGFDAEIEREVTSAACVLVCWTPEATKSIYVKGEAKKGLERDVLVPVFLTSCVLPVPFNAIDTADLHGWDGDPSDPRWSTLLDAIKDRVRKSKATELQVVQRSMAEYERIVEKVYPGTLRLLASRIAAKHDADAVDYGADIEAILDWIFSVSEKEAGLREYGYELADRQSGGGAWYWWHEGGAAQRSAQLSGVLERLRRIEEAIRRSQAVLDRPAP